MNKKIVSLLTLALLLTTASFAQKKTVDTVKRVQKKIIIKKGKDDAETTEKKVTVVVDGDKVTINGKPASEFNDQELEIINGMDGENFPMEINGQSPQNGKMFFFNQGPNDAKPNKALLGVSTEKVEEGAKVMAVSKESAAEKAGIKDGDIIVKLNDDKIEGPKELFDAVSKYKPEEKVKITYLRDGKENTTDVVLGKNKEIKVTAFKRLSGANLNDDIEMDIPQVEQFFSKFSPRPKLGFQVQDLEQGDGVKVLDVKEESPAAKAGLQKDDVITEVDGKELKNVDEMKNKLADLKEGEAIKLKYKRGNKTATTELKLPKKLKTANL